VGVDVGSGAGSDDTTAALPVDSATGTAVAGAAGDSSLGRGKLSG
jgi:hypothetical protein